MQVARGVTANGTVYAWQDVIVGPEVGGYRVAAVNVEVGDRVRKGQELVRLAEDMLAAEVASKRANLEQAQASLENAVVGISARAVAVRLGCRCRNRISTSCAVKSSPHARASK